MLNVLDQQGGRTTLNGLASQLNLPAVRLNGRLSALRRVLNADGFAVLSVDEQADFVQIDQALLKMQFNLS